MSHHSAVVGITVVDVVVDDTAGLAGRGRVPPPPVAGGGEGHRSPPRGVRQGSAPGGTGG